jgi:multidrug resistance protein, MATE family
MIAQRPNRPSAGAVLREVAATGRLAAPLVGGQLAYLGMNFLDTVMAGRLSAAALASVALGASLWSTVHLFLIGLLLALPAFVSDLDGQRTAAARERVGPLARQALWVALGASGACIVALWSVAPLLRGVGVGEELIPTVVAYLRALSWGIPAWGVYLVLRFLSEGLSLTRPTLYFGLLGLPLNALANLGLMYGRFGLPALGAVGCGYATAAVWWLQVTALVLYVARHDGYRDLDLFRRPERPRREAVGALLAVGLPIAFSLLMEGGLFTAAALTVGSLGTVPMAGHQVALNFAALLYMIPLGVSMALSVRVGNAVGARDPAAVRFRAQVGIGLAMLCQLVSATLLLLLPERIASVYTDDPAVAAVAVSLLGYAALFQLSDGLQVSSAAALRGLKDTRIPMLWTALAYWCLGLPLGWWLGLKRGLGAPGVWVGLIVGLSAAAVLLAARLVRVTRRLEGNSLPATEV